MNIRPWHLGQVIMGVVYHVGMPMAVMFTVVVTCPAVLNLTTPSIREVVIDRITTVTSSPMSEVPRLTTVAVAMGGYLKSDEYENVNGLVDPAVTVSLVAMSTYPPMMRAALVWMTWFPASRVEIVV